jgi:hypothetical protein
MLMEEDVDPESEDVDDAMGEITNMVAGQLKNMVCAPAAEAQLSIPVILRDGHYRLQVPESYDRWCLTATDGTGDAFDVVMVSSVPLQ